MSLLWQFWPIQLRDLIGNEGNLQAPKRSFFCNFCFINFKGLQLCTASSSHLLPVQPFSLNFETSPQFQLYLLSPVSMTAIIFAGMIKNTQNEKKRTICRSSDGSEQSHNVRERTWRLCLTCGKLCVFTAPFVGTKRSSVVVSAGNEYGVGAFCWLMNVWTRRTSCFVRVLCNVFCDFVVLYDYDEPTMDCVSCIM